MCERRDGPPMLLTVCGTRFYPRRELVKSFVTSWLDALDTMQPKLSCKMEMSAMTKDNNDIYRNKIKFDYYPNNNTRNRRVVNRLVERIMRVKSMCDEMHSISA